MTVCVAALCTWTYEDGNHGSAVVIASDRMMTSADTEYEPPKLKIGQITDTCLIMVSGDFTVQSQVVLITTERVKSKGIKRVRDIAEEYATCLREFKAKQASALYLEPLGLTLQSFSSGPAQVNENLLCRLAEQVQQYQVEAEAIIAGCDDKAHIYMVNQDGLASCHDDIGFAAIGIGYSHAKFQFMSSLYASWWPFFQTLVLTYAAKRSAEVAPGVGVETDMYYVTKHAASPVLPVYLEFLKKKYNEYQKKKLGFVLATVQGLTKIIFPKKDAPELPALEGRDASGVVIMPDETLEPTSEKANVAENV